MAQVTVNPKLDISISFTINEEEARALDALSGYGDDAFIKVFKEKLGETYMKNHEQGLRSFLRSIRTIVSGGLATLEQARQLFREYQKCKKME